MRRVMYDEERVRLLEDLKAAFTEKVFNRCYPGVPLPNTITIGGDTGAPPFEVIVRELPISVTNTMLSTCSDITSEFTLQVDLVASGNTLVDCTETLLAYCDVVHQVCMADPYLGGDVLSSTPEISQAGTDSDGSFGYVAGMLINVRLRKNWRKKKAVAKAVLNAHPEEVRHG